MRDVEKNGPCLKMSNQKMPVMGLTRWQDRHLTLNGVRLSWSLGASGEERNALELNSGMVIEKAEANSPKYKDCYRAEDRHSMSAMLTQPMGAMLSETAGTLDQNNCIAIRKPKDLSGTLNSAMGALNQSAMGMAFGGGAKKMQKEMAAADSRTYYFAFSSSVERDQWFDAIINNLEKRKGDDPVFAGGGEAAAFAQGLTAVGANLQGVDLNSYLDALFAD